MAKVPPILICGLQLSSKDYPIQCVGRGAVAQLIERYIRIVEVVGLNPISSTTREKNFRKSSFYKEF